MNTKRKPSLTDKFYAAQTPSNAVALAIGDHEASNPSGGSREFVYALHVAKDRLDYYGKLRAALQAIQTHISGGQPLDPGALIFDGDAADDTVSAYLGELLRKSPTVEA
jgi:hypothetical protein